MFIKVLTKDIKDASGKIVKVEPFVEITQDASDASGNSDKEALEKFKAMSKDVLKKRIDEALAKGLSPDTGMK